ncbi:MAG: hypothetical protein ABR540_09175 [Acidimicrobiales bacterium]
MRARLAIVGALVAAVVTVVANPPATAAVGDITVFAGTGAGGFTGDGGPATAAQINGANDTAVDAAGNVYIADTQNHSIRRVTPEGIITTVVGTGSPGFGGDGGPAASAQLDGPSSVAIDQLGNLLISESNNMRVRYVNFTASPVTVYGVTVEPGEIATVAGTGLPGFNGDNQPATSAQLNTPGGIDVDSAGNLFIADQANFRIRRVDRATGAITTVAGNGTSGATGDGGPATAATMTPIDLAMDSLGNLLIAEPDNQVVRYVNLTGSSVTAYGVTVAAGNIATVAGPGTAGVVGDGGPATSARLSYPIGVDVDSGDNLYIAALVGHRVRQVERASGTISTVAGTDTSGEGPYGGPALSAAFQGPVAVTIDNVGNLLIVDAPPNNRILKVELGVTTPTSVTPTSVTPTSVTPTSVTPTSVTPTSVTPTTRRPSSTTVPSSTSTSGPGDPGGGGEGAGGSRPKPLNVLARTGTSPLGLGMLATIGLVVGFAGRRAGRQADHAATASAGPSGSAPRKAPLSGLGLSAGVPRRDSRSRPKNWW